GQFLVENFSITYLATGRDLLRMQVWRESKSPPVLIANPLFDERGNLTLAMAKRGPAKSSSMAKRSISVGKDLASVYFAPLAGTEKEAQAIHNLFPAAHVLTGEQATKSTLEAVRAPQILHIATHGFFLEDQSNKSEAGTDAKKGDAAGDLENPLLRSGLALAGANSSHGA